jgi:hypothetical protein
LEITALLRILRITQSDQRFHGKTRKKIKKNEGEFSKSNIDHNFKEFRLGIRQKDSRKVRLNWLSR